MIKIDLFLMNPPYNSGESSVRKREIKGKDTKLCSNIMKSLEKYRVVCISNYAGYSALITKITQIERQKFPGVCTFTFIWTMNDNNKPLYNEIHRLKRVKKSNYFFLKISNVPIYQIRKTNNSEQNRTYIDCHNDEEMNEINKYIKEHWEPYKVFVPSVNWRTWIIANILYDSPWRDRFVK